MTAACPAPGSPPSAASHALSSMRRGRGPGSAETPPSWKTCFGSAAPKRAPPPPPSAMSPQFEMGQRSTATPPRVHAILGLASEPSELEAEPCLSGWSRWTPPWIWHCRHCPCAKKGPAACPAAAPPAPLGGVSAGGALCRSVPAAARFPLPHRQACWY